MSEPPGVGLFRPISPDVTQDELEDMGNPDLAGEEGGLPMFPGEDEDILPEFEDENDPDQLKLKNLFLSQQLEEAQAQIQEMGAGGADAFYRRAYDKMRPELLALRKRLWDRKRVMQRNDELRSENWAYKQKISHLEALTRPLCEENMRLAREVAVLQQEKASLETERANKNDIFQRLMTAAKQHESRHKALFAENARLTASEQALQAQNAALSERNARLEAQILQFGLSMQAAAGGH